MARALTFSSAALTAVLIFSCALHAQYGAGTAVGGQQAPNNNNATTTARAPARDLQGVWMRRTPTGGFSIPMAGPFQKSRIRSGLDIPWVAGKETLRLL